jgi:hypothetical protein
MLLHMRTTVRLDDDLARTAKARAAEQGITFTQLIDESLRERLANRPPRVEGAEPPELPTYGEGGLRAGVDLTDNRGLRDLMDDELPAIAAGPRDGSAS